MTDIEICEKIIKQQGCSYIPCRKCPIYENNDNPCFPCDRVEKAEEYLSKHKRVTMNELDRIKEELSELEIRIDKLALKRSNIPERGALYFSIEVEVNGKIWTGDVVDYYRLYHNNIWFDASECKRYNEIDKKYRKLVWELNQENPIDYNNEKQIKYYCFYEHGIEKGNYNESYTCKNQSIYCTKNIYNKAVELIGKEEFDWYLKEYRA